MSPQEMLREAAAAEQARFAQPYVEHPDSPRPTVQRVQRFSGDTFDDLEVRRAQLLEADEAHRRRRKATRR